MEPTVHERRLVIEIISTLVNIKSAMAEFVLRPAGVPADIYRSLLYRRDESTGRPLSKRQFAPLILDALEQHWDYPQITRNIIEIAAGWSNYHLAADEFAARATVQKARDVLGTLELMEVREAKQRELAKKEERARMERERANLLRQQTDLLLAMFDEIASINDHQRRGYLLQDLLNRVFDLHDIPVYRSFTRNEGGEQIDGAFKLDGWHYLVECRWRDALTDIRQLDGLKGQVDRSGKQAMGLFFSMNGWSPHVVPLLKQNPQKSIILMEGYALRTVLGGQIDFRDYILATVARLNLESEPFLDVRQYLRDQTP